MFLFQERFPGPPFFLKMPLYQLLTSLGTQRMDNVLYVVGKIYFLNKLNLLVGKLILTLFLSAYHLLMCYVFLKDYNQDVLK